MQASDGPRHAEARGSRPSDFREQHVTVPHAWCRCRAQPHSKSLLSVIHAIWNPYQVSADGFVSTMHSEDTQGTKNDATRLRWRKKRLSPWSNPLCELGSPTSGSRDHYCHSLCDTAKHFYNFYKRVQNLPCLYQRQPGCNLPSTTWWDSSTLTCFALTDFHWCVPTYKLITIYSPADTV